MANYKLTYDKEKDTKSHLYVYDEIIMQRVGLNTALGLISQNEEGKNEVINTLNCTRARYVGKSIFVYYKYNGIIGIFNVKENKHEEINLIDGISKIINDKIDSYDCATDLEIVTELENLKNKIISDADFVLENSEIKDESIEFKYNDIKAVFKFKTKLNIKGLNVSLKYWKTNTPVLHSDLQDESIWKIGRVVF